MKVALSIVYGSIIGTLLVAISGMLSIQAAGSLDGGVFGISNELVAVQSPALPVLQYIGMASSAVLALLGVEIVPSRASFLSPGASRIGCLVAIGALIVWSMIITQEVFVEASVREPPRAWLEGWVQYGGSESSVHLVVVLLLLTAVMGGLWAGRRAP